MTTWCLASYGCITIDGRLWQPIKDLNKRRWLFNGDGQDVEFLLVKIEDGVVVSIRIAIHKRGKKHRGGITHFGVTARTQDLRSIETL